MDITRMGIHTDRTNFTIVNFKPPIAKRDGRRTVGHSNAGSIWQFPQALQYNLLRLLIQCRCTLIQKQDRRAAQYRTCNSQTLCLSLGQTCAAFTDHCVQTIRKLL